MYGTCPVAAERQSAEVRTVTRICDLYKSFGDKQVLHGVSMDIPGGRITGLFGPSGCGKSTVARIACGLVAPDSGSILLNDRVLAAADGYDRKLGLSVQMVWQQTHASLDPSQRVGTGLKELIKYHKLADNAKHAEELMDMTLAEVGLSAQTAGHFPRQLSGGEAQRIALARALLLKPELLIMDEATSMLDVSTQANIAGLVRRLVNERNMAVLFISHDRQLLNVFADDLYVFENGRALKAAVEK